MSEKKIQAPGAGASLDEPSPVSGATTRRLPDAVLRALERAPKGAPLTQEERRIIAENRVGELIPGEVASAEIAERCRQRT